MIMFILACTGETKDTSVSEIEATYYYQDVAPILAQNCVQCHIEGGSGPFLLDNFENVKALGLMVEDSVVNRRMPPYHAVNDGECQDFEHSLWLSTEEVTTISNWVQSGMEAGEEVEVPVPDFTEEPFESTHSVTFEPYEANFATASDDYRCFIVDPQVASESYLTGFEVLPSNREIAHHMILYAPIGSAALAQAYAFDEADPGPGYSCYGSPGIENRMIAPWAPGSDQWYYPQGTGVLMEEGQILILQMHYSNASDETLDSTTVNLNIQETIGKELSTDFFTNGDLEIPPNKEEHVESVTRTIRNFSGYDGPINVHAIGPHLHQLGVSSSARIIRADDSESCLIDVPSYDFNWQRVYTYTEPIQLQPNDRMEITCVYDSTGVDTMTYWGDGTSDEMCLMTIFASIP
jgi:hypothetical protein